MCDGRSVDEGSEPSAVEYEPVAGDEDDRTEGPFVRVTRIGLAAGLALATAAANAAAPTVRRSESADVLSEVFGKQAGVDLPMLLVSVALATADRADRMAAAATLTARRAGRTAVGLADLTPLHPHLARWRAMLEARGEHGRRDAEDALVDLAGRYREIVDAVVADVVSRIDLDEIVGRVDLNHLVDRVDLDRVVGRVDLDQVVDRVDIDRAVRRVDIAALTEEVLEQVNVETIIRESTETATDEAVAMVRRRAAGADRHLARSIDKVFRRRGAREVELEPERES